MQRFRWQWRGGTYQNMPHGFEQGSLPKEIEIIDGRDGSQCAITDDVTKAERIVECLNYSEAMRRTT